MERDEKLCEIDSHRVSSHYFSSFLMTKLMDDEKRKSGYNYKLVTR